MANDRNAFKAGLFILITIVLIIAVIVGIKGIGHLLEPDQIRVADFKLADDVGGLRIGDDVRIGGMKVGIVRSVRIEQEGADGNISRVRVTFNIPRRLILRNGARIAVQSTLTGTSWLNFDSLGKGNPVPMDQPLPGSPSAYTVLADSMKELAPEIRKLTSDLRTITLPKVNQTADGATETFTAARSKIESVVQQFNKVADRTAEMMVKARDLFGDTTPDIRTMMADGAAAAGTLKQKLPPVLDDLDSALKKVNGELTSTTGVLSELRDTLANARDATASARSVLVSNHSKLDEMIESLKTTGDNLKYASAEIRHNPWRLLYKPKEGEVSNLNLFDATRQFAEGAGDLSDAATALRDALKDPQTDKARLNQLVQKLDDSFSQFQKVEGELWKQVKN